MIDVEFFVELADDPDTLRVRSIPPQSVVHPLRRATYDVGDFTAACFGVLEAAGLDLELMTTQEWTGEQVAPVVQAAILAMLDDAPRFCALEPSNRNLYADLVGFLRRIWVAAVLCPTATFKATW